MSVVVLNVIPISFFLLSSSPSLNTTFNSEYMAWSDLSVDLLLSISTHLSVIDFLRCSAVCTSWNSALTNNVLQIHCPPSPWLLLPSTAGEASETLTFRDLTIKEGNIGCHRRFTSLGSNIFDRRCIGSKDGWLVTLDKTNLQPLLFNPLTKAEISLPSLFTIPEDECQRIKIEYAPDGSIDYFIDDKHPGFGTEWEDFRDYYFRKIVLSSNDPSGTAVVIYGYTKLLAFARPSDQAWVLGPPLPPYHTNDWEEFEDVYFHEKEQRFYAITHFSLVLSFDLNGQNVKLICPAVQNPKVIDCAGKNYITFLSETLIKIERVISYTESEITKRDLVKTVKISVFKFVPNVVASSCSSSQWISVKDLSDCSLFIGCNQTFSIHHTVAPEIKPNCVYFTDHWEYTSPQKDMDCDAGLFDLHNDCFQYFLNSELMSNWPPSILFTPSLS